MRIHEQNEILKEQIKILLGGFEEIKRYLNSSKFDTDNMVNKNDILLRIQDVRNHYNDTPAIVEGT